MIYPTLQRVPFKSNPTNHLASLPSSPIFCPAWSTPTDIYVKKNDRKSLITRSGIFWISTDAGWLKGLLSFSALNLQNPCAVCTPQPVAKRPWKPMATTWKNKSNNMMNKPDRVHFKTRVGYFALVWETKLSNLDITIGWVQAKL